ncbi:Transposase family Tnp2 protein [Ceratobasidium theobromae]|uniref:Transposase family Tnp2 protein n=1 Tax=Ceratobasidium theobromae TaxID=1582974 RepID=A0A5N5Q7X5_9AGAM|nr:Transposase family Tnp2 protein [Ceratobasidium theobromae]
MPLIPQLRALFCNPATRKEMEYRHNYKSNNGIIQDIFDGERYHKLRDTYVAINGQQKPYKFFEDEREVALGFATDGMCPFKRRKHSCWPLVLINYNLPPEIRTHIDNLLCVGLVPGPKSPKNLGSFLIPLIEELIELASGTPAVDYVKGVIFALRAHILAGFGDIPAISKILEFLGHNGHFPCRLCLIKSVRGVTAKGGTHLYCPLHRSGAAGPPIDPLQLQLRQHDECVRLGFEVLKGKSDNARAKLAAKSGIKGVSVFHELPSVSIPNTFPVDIMHMVWINLVPQLTKLWTGTFNMLDDGREDYSIHPTVWDALAKLTESSGSTIPSSFGCRVPNLNATSHFTAESWSMWATLLAPSLLRRRFRRATYYIHFVQLIKLLNRCTSFSIRRDEINDIRQGLAKWVQDYERIYYQYNPSRIQTCTVNLHYLLHIADSVELLGPVWCYWTFPMERFCSYVGASVKSRRFPYANIVRRIRDVTQLRIIRDLYHLQGELSFKPIKPLMDTDEDCKDAEKLPDCKPQWNTI